MPNPFRPRSRATPSARRDARSHGQPQPVTQTRRDWLRGAAGALVAAAALPLLGRVAVAEAGEASGSFGAARTADVLGDALQPRAMTVYKTPSCGCCKAWVEHVQQAGFKVTVRDMADLSEVKAAFGVPAALQSCHTAQIGGYLVEGHVPADLVTRLLKEKPTARGLAVPGMPVGSPGMEGGTPEKYQVLLFDKAGGTRVYATR